MCGDCMPLHCPSACSLDWYVENNNTVTWPFDLAADQLTQRLTAKNADAPFGPGYGCDAATSRLCCIGYSNATCPACSPGYGIPRWVDALLCCHQIPLFRLSFPEPEYALLLSSYCLCSKLWGCKGELFDMPNSLGSQRLLDWSYAGYMAGEMPIPRLPLVGSVMDFGAVGDGVTDDTNVSIHGGRGPTCESQPGWTIQRKPTSGTVCH